MAELGVMREYGMAPGETLAAATSTAAAVLGRGESVGTVETGKTADLLILDSNPLEDPANLLDMWGVVHHGRLRRGVRDTDRASRLLQEACQP